MSRKEYNDVAELYQDLLNDIEKVAAKEISKEMIKIEQETIDKEVYAKFTPKVYDRRYDNGGLKSEANMETKIGMEGDSIIIEILNTTTGNPNSCPGYYRGYIQPLVEEGIYIWNGEMPPPRPFIDPAQEVIDNTDRLDDILDDALKNLGW